MQPLLRKNQSKLPRPSNRDRIVWTLTSSGVSDDEIQQRLRMTIDDLAVSKLRMLSYTQSVSNAVVSMTNNEILLSVGKSGNVQDAINGALKAERVLVTSAGIVIDPQTQQPVTEPDHDMRLMAARTYTRLVKDNRPTGPMVAVNTNISNSNTQNNLIAGGRSFEARRRAAAERRGAVSGVVAADAEVVDEDEVIDAEDVELDDPDVAEDMSDDDGDDEE